jgi:hypothetical protein
MNSITRHSPTSLDTARARRLRAPCGGVVATALLIGAAPMTAQSWTATPVGPYTPISPTLAYVTMNGNNANSSFGQAVSRLGDLTGDNRADVLIGAPDEVGFIANQFPGQAHVRSGRTGAEYVLPFPNNMIGSTSGDQFGHAVAGLPDIDADGLPDMIIGAPQGYTFPAAAGYARVISGGTGLMIALPPPLPGGFPNIVVGGFGYDVADAGDVNNDGINDYVVGAPFTAVNGVQHGGLAQVYSGATGANLVFAGSGGTIPGLTTNSLLAYLGISVGAAGDWNGDGFDDVIVGAYNPNGIGFANVYSGRWITSQIGPQILSVLQGNSVTDGFGISCHAAGDVNGDGLGDVIVGTYFGDYIEVFTGSTAVTVNPPPLYSISMPNSVGFGYAVSGGLDVDGDGVSDFVAGPSGSSSSPSWTVRVYSGATGAQIQQHAGPSAGYFGIAVDLSFDLNANGRAEVLVGEPLGQVGGTTTGKAYLFIN